MSSLVAFVLGLAALVIGAELVVREGSALAARLGIHPIVVGLTVVSLGTSLPELAIGLNAAQQGNAGMAVGNIVGTNLVNVLLILGVSALIRAVAFEARTLLIDLPAMTGASVLLFILARDGTLSNSDGWWMCVYGVGYLMLLLVSTRRETRSTPVQAPAPVSVPDRRLGTQLLWLLGGLVVIVVGAELIVDGAVEIARDLGVSDAVIGLTVLAIGTSAPELVTTLVATVRGDRSIALGNLMGSSVFNIALILGPTVLVAPGVVLVPDDVLAVDLLLMVAAAVICVPVFWSRRRLGRVEGGAFVVAYVSYLTWLLTTRL